MITDYKITEIFCATDEFSKKFDEEIENMPLLGTGITFVDSTMIPVCHNLRNMHSIFPIASTTIWGHAR